MGRVGKYLFLRFSRNSGELGSGSGMAGVGGAGWCVFMGGGRRVSGGRGGKDGSRLVMRWTLLGTKECWVTFGTGIEAGSDCESSPSSFFAGVRALGTGIDTGVSVDFESVISSVNVSTFGAGCLGADCPGFDDLFKNRSIKDPPSPFINSFRASSISSMLMSAILRSFSSLIEFFSSSVALKASSTVAGFSTGMVCTAGGAFPDSLAADASSLRCLNADTLTRFFGFGNPFEVALRDGATGGAAAVVDSGFSTISPTKENGSAGAFGSRSRSSILNRTPVDIVMVFCVLLLLLFRNQKN